VVPYTSEYKDRWNDFIAMRDDGSFHQLIAWKDIIEGTFQFKSYSFMAIDAQGSIRGVLPLFLVKNLLRRRYLISIPFVNYAGICALDPSAEKALVDKAVEMSAALDVQYVQIKQLSRQFDSLQATDNLVTMMLRLNKSSEVVWRQSLQAKTRNQVRKSQKYEFDAKFTKDHFNSFYSVYSTNLKRLGTPVLPRRFFQRILEVFPENTEILTVWKAEKPIAGMFIFKYKSMLSDPWASSLWEYNRYCPNNFMYWEAIQYACHQGFEFFDMGRSTIDSGTFQFKKQWGAIPKSLAYQYHLHRAKKIPVVDAVDNRYDYAIRIWKKMPIKLANALGPRLVKYLPEY